MLWEHSHDHLDAQRIAEVCQQTGLGSDVEQLPPAARAMAAQVVALETELDDLGQRLIQRIKDVRVEAGQGRLTVGVHHVTRISPDALDFEITQAALAEARAALTLFCRPSAYR